MSAKEVVLNEVDNSLKYPLEHFSESCPSSIMLLPKLTFVAQISKDPMSSASKVTASDILRSVMLFNGS